MEYFAGLDVAMEETSICVVDQEGRVVLETSVATDPDAIFEALKTYVRSLRRVGHEAGSLSPWLPHSSPHFLKQKNRRRAEFV